MELYELSKAIMDEDTTWIIELLENRDSRLKALLSRLNLEVKP